MTNEQKTKSGFVSVVGRPNVGKSTLVNRLVGSKVAITSPRPQTTRNRILGVVHRPGLQIILLDTPGVTEAHSKLTESMVDASIKAGGEGDIQLFVTEATKPDIEAEKYVLGRIGERSGQRFLALNKIDIVKKNRLIETIGELTGLEAFDEIVPVSAKTGENVDKLLEVIADALPEGPAYYPDDMLTDQPEMFVIGEVIREKAFFALQQEVPFSTAVVVRAVEDRPNNVVAIAADIIIERDSQKGIVIGKKGAMLKKIGTAARKDLEARLNARVFLDIAVKVKAKWTKDEKFVHRFGYGRQ